METRANYVAIGVFVLIVFAGALASLWWLYRSSQSGATETVRIIFPEPVTGLSPGGSVLFNGIRVGEVVSLEFPPEGGDNVIAITRLNPSAPIKVDTLAKLSFQGLTGVAYISLTGGSKNAPSLFAAAADSDGPPTIEAETSAFTNVLDSAQSVLARMNTTLDEVNTLIRDNRSDVDAVVGNVRTLTQSLADVAPRISGLVTDVANAGGAIADAVPQIASVVERANALLGAIDADQVGTIVDNVDSFSGQLATIGDEAKGVVDTVNGLVTRLDDAAGVLGEAVGVVRDVVSAVDRNALADIVGDVRTAAGVFADRSAAIGTLVDNASVISGEVRSVTATLATRTEAIGRAIDDAGALIAEARGAVSAAAPAIEGLGRAVASVAPDRVTAIVDNIEAVTASLAGDTEAFSRLLEATTDAATRIESVAELISDRNAAIATALDDAAGLMANLRSASDQAPAVVSSAADVLARVGGVVDAVDADAINALVGDARRFAGVLAAQAEAIGPLVQSVSGTATRAEAIASALAKRMPQIGSAIDNVAAISADTRSFAQQLPAFAETLRPGVDNLSAVLTAVDPASVANLADAAGRLAATLQSQAPKVESIVGAAEATAIDAQAIAARLRGELDTMSGGLADARAALADARTFAARLPALAQQIEPGVTNLADVFAAIDPAAVQTIVSNVRDVSATLADARAGIASLVETAGNAAQQVDRVAGAVAARTAAIEGAIDNVAGFAGELRAAGPQIDRVADAVAGAATSVRDTVSALDVQSVNEIVSDVRSAAAIIGSRADEIGAAIDNAYNATRSLSDAIGGFGGKDGRLQELMDGAQVIIDNVRSASTGLGTLIDRANAVLGEELNDAFSGFNNATAEVARIAEAFAPRANEIASGLSRFSQAGLDDLRALINQGRSTLSAIERAVSSFDRNPSRVIFGGSDGPRYEPQRR